MTVDLSPSAIQTVLIVALTIVAVLGIWTYRQQIAAIKTPYIDKIVGMAVFYFLGISILVDGVTAVLSIVGVTGTIRALSPEATFYYGAAFAAIAWARKQLG